MIRIGKLPSNYGPASVLGAAIGSLTGVLASRVLCQQPLPFLIEHWDQHLAGWISLRLHELNPALLADIAARYQYFLDSSGVPIWQITGRFDAAALLGLGVGAAVTWLIGKPLPDTKIIAGRHLYEGKDALKRLQKISKEEISISDNGVHIHPLLEISRSRATRGIFFWGSIGSGKTQAMIGMILDAIRGGHKTLIHDIKGDYTSSLDVPFALLAPWDARTMAWDIAKDILDPQAAFEFAAQTIKPTTDPIWSDGSRQVLCGVIMDLQKENPGNWTWRDLHTRTLSSQDKLIEIVRKQVPEIDLVLKTESKTTDGILMNFVTALRVIGNLAKAWGDVKPENRFSITEWLHSENPRFKTVILQNSGEYPMMAEGYLKAFMSMLSGRINTPKFGDSQTRKVFLFLDELPQMGEIKLDPILACGRSKGTFAVISAQDKSQIEHIFGNHIAKAWCSIIGTQVVLRTNSSDTAEYLSKTVVGYATIEKSIMQDGKVQICPPVQQLVLEPTDISDYLGVNKNGVTGALIGFGDAFIVQWPFTKIKKLREASIPGKWMETVQENDEDQQQKAEIGKTEEPKKQQRKFPGALGKQSKPKGPQC